MPFIYSRYIEDTLKINLRLTLLFPYPHSITQGDPQHGEGVRVQTVWQMLQEEQHSLHALAHPQVNKKQKKMLHFFFTFLTKLFLQRHAALPLSVLWQEVPPEK